MTTSEVVPAKAVPDPFADLHRKRRPWWIVFVLVLAAFVAGGVIYARKHRGPSAPKYLTAHVTRGDVIETIEATGTVQPLVQVQVGSQVSGRIQRLGADFNTQVHHGDLIAEIDPTPFRAQVAAQRAQLASAQASLTRAQADLALQERNLTRAQDLRNRGLNAQADLDAALGARDSSRAQVLVARATIEQTRASLAQAETNLEYTRIYAPIDGVVVTRSIDVGQTVAASFTAPVLFVIANDLRQMQIVADIDEADVGKLHEAMSVDARVDAFPGDVFHGTVRELRYGATTTAGVVTYPAVINVANPEIKLRPGMTTNITVTTARHENVLRVPNSALRFRPSSLQGGGGGGRAGGRAGGGAGGGGGGAGGGAGRAGGGRAGGDTGGAAAAHTGRVFIVRNGEAVPVRVHIGVSDGTYTEVEAPELTDSSEVITDETDDSIAQSAARPGGGGGGGSKNMPRRMF